MKAEVFKIRKSMSLEDRLENRILEKSFNQTMGNLAESLPAIKKSLKTESEKDQKNMILQKSFELLKEQKLSIIDCGIIESRLNKGLPLSKAHIAALGLNDLQKGFENLPTKKPVTSGVLKIDQANEIEKMEDQGIEREPDSLSAYSQAGDYEFINISGQTIKVRKAEILRKTGEAVKAGKIDVIEGGIIEYRLNRNGKIPDHVLRYLFE